MDLPADVLGLILSHLAPSWLCSARRTCRAFRSASFPLVRTLKTIVPDNDVLQQLHALSCTTNLMLEVRGLRSVDIVANPLCSARLCRLELINLPQDPRDLSSAATVFNEWAQSPHVEAFPAGLAAATRLTSVTLVNCRAALSLVLPACPQLRDLAMQDAQDWSSCALFWQQSLTALSLASSLHTLHCDLPLFISWAALLA